MLHCVVVVVASKPVPLAQKMNTVFEAEKPKLLNLLAAAVPILNVDQIQYNIFVGPYWIR